MSVFSKKNNNNKRVGATQLSRIDLLFYNSGIIKRLAKNIEPKLIKAGSTQDPKLFASRLFFILIFSIMISLIFVIFSVRLFELYRLTLEVKYLAGFMVMIVFAIIIPPISYISQILQISQEIENRRIGLDSEAPAFSAIFNVFLKSGISARFVFEYLSNSAAMRYASQISSYINKRVKYLGEGVESAISESLKISPSKVFNEFLLTYVTAVRTGAPVLETMEAKAKDILKNIEVLASTAADNLSGVAEGFVIWLSSGFITFFLVMLLQAIFPSLIGSVPFPVIASFAIFLVPIVNLMFIWVTDQTQFRFPERSLKAYKIFYITFPIGIILSLLILYLIRNPIPLLIPLLYLTGGPQQIPYTILAFTIGLLVAVIPPGILAMKELREGTGYDTYVVSFLRSIAEGLRAGLNPETVIKTLKDSPEMGKFRDVLNTIYVYTVLGVPMKDAFKKAADRILDFSSRISLISLADMIEIGSLTPETVEALADQVDAQIRIRRSYNSKIRVLLYAPYVGIILALVASILLGNAIYTILLKEAFVTSYGPLAAARGLLPKALYVIAISSIFNSFLAGLLVGKIGYGKTAAGFIHSAILIVITAILVIISLHISLIPSISPSSTSL
ncbi:flagellar assembly protein [Sulfolobus sp. A20]|uniref:type II secretion system F family protein n=1 Tax=Sulfolobaceae TaxID=118883 RepID=UPI000845F757|nr:MULTISPECIES: type II secretion system F family protein [unclassified Sulfolobus]TRM75392.1 flagellar assembly protein [Sulfolobus sp. E5]TRM77624.1 flagellar assembly protein [Sulfolobus sp. B5]TRM78438.1 flagellar assembly protein [Sulfolobus sp. A20-N-F8]TRM89193.1 flagellar assembly protein [Sulfolobus sp. C3]TRM92764.1 flagellar assembly protein [Sulfolobus sp. A20-N-G8]TRN02083.1 flagellar assembly protein [Sulfolobus sp. E1]TRN03591.1 flagellar assembly protein [Sulfolobus sp. F1]